MQGQALLMSCLTPYTLEGAVAQVEGLHGGLRFFLEHNRISLSHETAVVDPQPPQCGEKHGQRNQKFCGMTQNPVFQARKRVGVTRKHQPTPKPDGEVPGLTGEVRACEGDFPEAKQQDFDEDQGQDAIQQAGGGCLSKTQVQGVNRKGEGQDWKRPQDNHGLADSREKCGAGLPFGQLENPVGANLRGYFKDEPRPGQHKKGDDERDGQENCGAA